MNKMTGKNRDVKNKEESDTYLDVKLDFDQLQKKMGDVAFHTMEVAYSKWVQDTKIRGKKSKVSIMGSGGKTISSNSVEVEYPNASPKKHETFVREYLDKHNMKSMLED